MTAILNARWSCLCGLLLAAALLVAARPGQAASGDWFRRDHSAVRLLQGEAAGGALRAGVEFVLGDGWKTYWRMPGESGVPAEFDWSGSHNVANVDVHWPAPHRMHDAAGEGVGYQGHVVFPLTVRLARPDEPARLDLKLFYAVCNDFCMPVSAELSLDLEPGLADRADAEIIAHYQGLVPGDDRDGKALLAARAVMPAGKPHLAVIMARELPATDVDIFVEGFDEAYFRKPRPGAVSAGERQFLLPVDGIADAAALKGRVVRITWIAGNKSLFRDLEVE